MSQIAATRASLYGQKTQPTGAPKLQAARGIRSIRRKVLPPVSALATASTASSKQIQEFWQWMQQNSVVDEAKTAVQPKALEEGAGLVSKRNLKKGETLLTIPEAVTMNYAAALKSDIGKYLEGLKPWLAVTLFLLHERNKGAASKWAPYVSLLPSALGLPMFWSEDELKELEGTQVLESTLGYMGYAESEFEGVQEYVFGPNPSVFPPEVYNAESFLWAFGILRSRTFAPFVGESIALVPGLDLMNHNAYGVVKLERRKTGLFSGESAAALVSVAASVEGEQVYMNYGDKNNSQLLLDYGFVETSMTAMQGAYLLTLSIPEGDINFGDKVDIVELVGLKEQWQFNLQGQTMPDADMLTYLRLIQMQGTDSFLLESIFRDTAWNLCTLPVSLVNETAVCECMVEGCRAALSVYPTSIGEDEQILARGDLSERMYAAVVARQGEKRALYSTMGYFEQRIQLLPTMEYYQERRLKDLGLLEDDGTTTYDDFFSTDDRA
mmetsp:Transcript_17680/g.29708  ORF Transcript_17680/g.29708 Transcript_17680/m.29708 type:complete len:496 (+) Transcript_17680:79-1566(+)